MKLFILLVTLLVFPTTTVQRPVRELIRNCVFNYLDPACHPKIFNGKQNAKEQGEQSLVQKPSRYFANNCSETDIPADFSGDCDNGDTLPADFKPVDKHGSRIPVESKKKHQISTFTVVI
ncbi:hypothetical protein L5515_019513 [Caenorhabditis briggsae]|uniref:Uncharacterized protein n=1 Tax=Caenorhabditis briggsae TaxID=6238 RepID=A0AAE9FJ56_CAEBR|nr:hypothetical protein L5515_019513 [Caenorhabditis briggsae]